MYARHSIIQREKYVKQVKLEESKRSVMTNHQDSGVKDVKPAAITNVSTTVNSTRLAHYQILDVDAQFKEALASGPASTGTIYTAIFSFLLQPLLGRHLRVIAGHPL